MYICSHTDLTAEKVTKLFLLHLFRNKKKKSNKDMKSIPVTLLAPTIGKHTFSGTYKSSYLQSTIAPRRMALSSNSRPTSSYDFFYNGNIQYETNDIILDTADQVPSHFDH